MTIPLVPFDTRFESFKLQPEVAIPNWVWVNTYRYIFSGMNIHKSQLFWGSPGVQGFDPSPTADVFFVPRSQFPNCLMQVAAVVLARPVTVAPMAPMARTAALQCHHEQLWHRRRCSNTCSRFLAESRLGWGKPWESEDVE